MKKTDAAFSYLRWSSAKQRKGRSQARQMRASEQWCKRNGVQLDKSQVLIDDAASGFTGEHRSNPDRYALARFLQQVREKKIPRGSYLIVENLDRLTREDIQPALRLVLDLLAAGVRLVQLRPVEMVFTDKSDAMAVMLMIVELSRGNSESRMKSDRVGEAWEERRRRSRDEGATLTRQLPAWVEQGKDGERHPIPHRAAAVHRIFQLAAAGYGTHSICKRLTCEGHKPIGRKERWSKSYIGKILKDRRAVGEFQPRSRRDGKPAGPPIPNYFPAVVSENEWLAARGGMEDRGKRRGRIGSHVNVFAGLLTNARDGKAYHCQTWTYQHGTPARRVRVLVNYSSADEAERCYSFPFASFEEGLLERLREINPADVIGADRGAAELQVLEGKHSEAVRLWVSVKADLDAGGDSPTLYALARKREAVVEDLAAQLKQAQRRAAHPLSAVWAEQLSLLKTVNSSPDPEDARLRLRGLLRITIDRILLLVIPLGKDRIAAVQIWFKGGKRFRTYLIQHQGNRLPASLKDEPRWKGITCADMIGREGYDLRKARDVVELERDIQAAYVGRESERDKRRNRRQSAF